LKLWEFAEKYNKNGGLPFFGGNFMKFLNFLKYSNYHQINATAFIGKFEDD